MCRNSSPPHSIYKSQLGLARHQKWYKSNNKHLNPIRPGPELQPISLSDVSVHFTHEFWLSSRARFRRYITSNYLVDLKSRGASSARVKQKLESRNGSTKKGNASWGPTWASMQAHVEPPTRVGIKYLLKTYWYWVYLITRARHETFPHSWEVMRGYCENVGLRVGKQNHGFRGWWPHSKMDLG